MRPPLLRSYLYVPASDAEMVRKALSVGADAVVLDLEDAVPTSRKGAARDNVVALLREDRLAHGAQLHVRINRDGHSYDREDIEAIVRPGLDAIRLPKAESRDAIEEVAAELGRLEGPRGLPGGHVGLYPTVESAVGAVGIGELATASRVVRLAYGAADLVTDLGLPGPDGDVLNHLRAELVLRSRVAGIGAPVDTVFTRLDDDAGLRAAAEVARRAGFSGKSIIHPCQLGPVHAAFSPTESEVARAQEIVNAVATAGGNAGGIVVAGEFVDPPIVDRARALLELWKAIGDSR